MSEVQRGKITFSCTIIKHSLPLTVCSKSFQNTCRKKATCFFTSQCSGIRLRFNSAMPLAQTLASVWCKKVAHIPFLKLAFNTGCNIQVVISQCFIFRVICF